MKVHFTKEGKTLEMKQLQMLWKAGEEGIEFLKDEKHCGGQGKCQKCKCKVNGKIELSCQYQLWGDEDLEVETGIE